MSAVLQEKIRKLQEVKAELDETIVSLLQLDNLPCPDRESAGGGATGRAQRRAALASGSPWEQAAPPPSSPPCGQQQQAQAAARAEAEAAAEKAAAELLAAEEEEQRQQASQAAGRAAKRLRQRQKQRQRQQQQATASGAGSSSQAQREETQLPVVLAGAAEPLPGAEPTAEPTAEPAVQLASDLTADLTAEAANTCIVSTATEPDADADAEVELLMQQLVLSVPAAVATPGGRGGCSALEPALAAAGAGAGVGAAAAAAAAAATAGTATSALIPDPGLPARLDPALLSQLLCPISQEPMVDPVVAADGTTFERAAIEGGCDAPATGLMHAPTGPSLTLRQRLHRPWTARLLVQPGLGTSSVRARRLSHPSPTCRSAAWSCGPTCWCAASLTASRRRGCWSEQQTQICSRNELHRHTQDASARAFPASSMQSLSILSWLACLCDGVSSSFSPPAGLLDAGQASLFSTSSCPLLDVSMLFCTSRTKGLGTTAAGLPHRAARQQATRRRGWHHGRRRKNIRCACMHARRGGDACIDPYWLAKHGKRVSTGREGVSGGAA